MASRRPGGTIEVRYDSPTGPLLGKTAMITPTGDWQTYKNVSLPLTGVPAGTHELFLVTRNPGQTASLLNINWIDFVGKGAAQTAAPDVTASATPLTGAAPLPVAFTSTATDPDGGDARLRVGLRRPRHDDGHVDAAVADATPTPTRATTRATLTVTDGQGGTTTKTFAIRVTAPAALRHDVPRRLRRHRPRRRLDVVRRDQALVVSRRHAEDPDRSTATSTAATTTPRTSCCAPAPSGPWTITAKIKHAGNRQYHQAGLIVYGDDDNYTKFDRLADNAPADAGDRALRVHQRGRGHAAQPARPTRRRPARRDLPGRLLHEDRVRRDADPRLLVDRRHRPGRWSASRRTCRPATSGSACSRSATRRPRTVTAEFDWFTLTTAPAAGGGGAGDEFNGTIARQDALERDRPRGHVALHASPTAA